MRQSEFLCRAIALDRVSPTVAQGLVDALFERDAVILQGTVVLLIASLVGFATTGSRWMLIWGGCSLPLACVRFYLTHRYWQRRDRCALQLWVWCYLACAWLAALLWSCTGIVILVEPDTKVHLMFIACLTAFVNSGVVRNSPIRLVANGQALVALVPLFLASLATRDPFYCVYSILPLFNLFACLNVARTKHEQTVAFLQAGEENRALASRLGESNRKLERMVETDALTRLLNRRGFDLNLAQAWETAVGQRGVLSLLLLDVDHFKQFNDLYGHLGGDDCLRAVAGVLHGCIRRPDDVVARFGGEEFTIILPGADEQEAACVAERVQSSIELLHLPHAGTAVGRVTLSIGIATVASAAGMPPAVDTPASLIRAADEALYRAKGLGRNRIVAGRGLRLAVMPVDQ